MSFDPRTGLSPFGGGTFADTLAQVAGAVSQSFQFDVERKNNQIKSMLEQAKQFGIPGLRKLYADPTFTGLVASVPNLKLPPLPEPSSEELLEDRKRELLTKFKEGVASGKNPGQLRVELGREYPDVAKDLGISFEIGGSNLNSLIGAISRGLDPGQYRAALEAVYAPIGGLANAPEAERSIAALGMSERVLENAQLLRDRHTQMIAAAGLTGARANEINKLLDAKLEKLKADIDLIREGKLPLDQAEARYKQYQADVERDFGPMLAKFKAQQMQTGADLNVARTFYYKELTAIKDLDRQADAMLGGPGGPKNLKAYMGILNTKLKYEQGLFSKLLTERDKLADQLSGGAITPEEYKDDKAQYDNDIKELRAKIQADMSELDRVQKGFKSGKTGAGEVAKPTFNFYKYPSDYKGPKVQASEIWDNITTRFPPAQWFEKWKQARTSEQLRGVPNDVWNQVTSALMTEYKRQTGKNWGESP